MIYHFNFKGWQLREDSQNYIYKLLPFFNMNKYLEYLNKNYFKEINYIQIESKMNKMAQNETHPFENQIFHAFRQKQKKIMKAIKLLKKNGFEIIKNVTDDKEKR